MNFLNAFKRKRWREAGKAFNQQPSWQYLNSVFNDDDDEKQLSFALVKIYSFFSSFIWLSIKLKTYINMSKKKKEIFRRRKLGNSFSLNGKSISFWWFIKCLLLFSMFCFIYCIKQATRWSTKRSTKPHWNPVECLRVSSNIFVAFICLQQRHHGTRRDSERTSVN